MARIEIIPAIMPMTYEELEDQVSLVTGFVGTVQIDVCDGQFVPNATWPYRKHDDTFEKLVREEVGLPGWEDLNFEIDLMANRPEERMDDWIQAGASRLILHVESKGFSADTLAKLAGRIDVGIALSEETSIDTIAGYRENISFIQLMGIDRIGFQHQPFDDKVIGRVKEARLKYPGLPISVDGGVSLDNAQALIDAGADRLVVGSAIFADENPTDAVEKFRRLS